MVRSGLAWRAAVYRNGLHAGTCYTERTNVIRQPMLAFLVLAGAGVVGANDPPPPRGGAIRVATYNVAMYREATGQLAGDLSGDDAQAKKIAEVIQRVRPDVLLLCEIDDDPKGEAVRLFAERYVAVGQAGLPAIDFPHRFTAPVNTGVPSGMDLNGDGDADDPDDAWGYGRYPGQYGMAVLSQLPIDHEASRTFQRLRWSRLPGARRPIAPTTGDPYYADEVWNALRLPSKSLFHVVVRTPDDPPLHLIASHPTPPVFDGPEDRNGCRNADEVRLLREYVSGNLAAYFVDDSGRGGALDADAAFVILGDLNADPVDGSGRREAIRRLLANERLASDPAPKSVGAVAAVERWAELNGELQGEAARHTGNFGPDGHANLRIDYALPSANLQVRRSGVYWPAPGEPGAEAAAASDHRLVWVDVSFDGRSPRRPVSGPPAASR